MGRKDLGRQNKPIQGRIAVKKIEHHREKPRVLIFFSKPHNTLHTGTPIMCATVRVGLCGGQVQQRDAPLSISERTVLPHHFQ